MYLEYDCQHNDCKYMFLMADTDEETEYTAQLRCSNCNKWNEVEIKITALGLPLKED